jgi:hypothetical protein
VGFGAKPFLTSKEINSNLVLKTITEGKQLQFRAEAFNIFNHAQFTVTSPSPGGGTPAGNFNNTGQGGFGYITTANNPRIMQVALKFLF